MIDFTTTEEHSFKVSDSWTYDYTDQFPKVVEIPFSEEFMLNLFEAVANGCEDSRLSDLVSYGVDHWLDSIQGREVDMTETVDAEELRERVFRIYWKFVDRLGLKEGRQQ